MYYSKQYEKPEYNFIIFLKFRENIKFNALD